METFFLIKLFVLLLIVNVSLGLRCQTDDGRTDAELKRVVRKCMRKISENFNSNSEGKYRNQNTYYNDQRYNNDNDYEYEDQWNRFDNPNHYHRSPNHETSTYQRSRDRLLYNNTDGQNNGYNGQGNNRNEKNRKINNNRNNNNGGGNNRHPQNNSNNSRNGNGTYDKSCATHCFFEELNMINSDEYPDRQRAIFVLTKQIRDRELRSFYIDTIQECFRFLESSHRPDKCSFSRELVNCMTVYFKANCEDWNQTNLIFT